MHDDIWVMFYSFKSLSNEFIQAYHGRFITNTIAAFIGVQLPLTLNIHPIEWMHSGAILFKSFFIFIICFLLSSNVFIFRKDNVKLSALEYFYIIISTLLFYFLYQNAFLKTYQSSMYMSFYGFTFPFIVYFIFWNFLIRQDLYDYKKSNKSIFILCILSFLIGYSSEFFSFSTFASLTLMIVYFFFKEKEKILEFLPIYISNIIGFILYVALPGFYITCSDGTKLFISTCSSLNELFDWLNEAYNSLLTVIYNDFLIYTIAILILYLVIFKSKVELKNKKIIGITFYFIGILCIVFSMLLVKRHFPGENDYIYIAHFDIIQQIKIGLMFLITALISCLLNFRIIFNIFRAIFFTILLCFTTMNFHDILSLLTTSNNDLYIDKYCNRDYEQKVLRYKMEYMLLEQISRNKDIYLLDNNSIFKVYPYDCDDYIYLVYRLNYKYANRNESIIVHSIDEYYEQYLKDGNRPINNIELIKADFNKLLKKYRK